MISLKRFSRSNPLLRREKILRLLEGVLSKVAGAFSGFAIKKREWNALIRSGAISATTDSFSEVYQVLIYDQVISRELYLRGEFDFKKLQRAHRYVQKSCGSVKPILIDVGANLGSICIPAIKRGLFEKASAIEANSTTVEVLRNNISLNHLEASVTVYQVVAGAPESNPVAIKHNDLNLGASKVVQNYETDQLMEVVPLDNLIFDIGEVGLVFMDVEGYEGNVLLGASTLLRSGVPVALELSPNLLKVHISKEDFCSLMSGYSGFYSLNDPLQKFYSIEKLGLIWDWYEKDLQGEQTDLIFLRKDWFSA